MLALARARLPGVPLHHADMAELDLGRSFDVVTCLFSSIGFTVTYERLRKAAEALARHVTPGGILLVEPWFSPADWWPHSVHMQVVDEPDLKVACLSRSEVSGTLSRVPMYFTVATPDGVRQFSETLELGLFEVDEYLDAFADAGLDVEHFLDVGLAGRGLYLGTRPQSGDSGS
jgi:SAM-dependent methyltransferase